uniref:Uncharacterized protein n=1 Tax=Chromera velia CCMP2878 TaxID=1169474 RepID=A0A0G4GK60_9ALVE|eukprot:Cvel_4814.t1-p1 / transcript=Cvel_4814.t1 / gene=Cvel_4814 / organism=Chromera_velia_CCMP2878 / gene_product=hypothetical protein / transcript_product=hypothetical protein / location=Cvel_scaffold216:52250-76474(+) / protein_length=5602 / sequence_SO=supercontig / SO=protein_coding / is_pseudo=false
MNLRTPRLEKEADAKVAEGAGLTSFPPVPREAVAVSLRNNRLTVVPLPIPTVGGTGTHGEEDEGAGDSEETAVPLSRLRCVELSRNRLVSLDGLWSCLSLDTLSASDNWLSAGSLVGIGTLKNLRVLRLSGNRLQSAAPWGRALRQLPLQVLDVSLNQISDICEHLICPLLEELQTASNNLTTLEFREKMPLLWKIDARDNNIQRVSCLRDFAPSLRELLLDDNRLGGSLSVEILSHEKLERIHAARGGVSSFGTEREKGRDKSPSSLASGKGGRGRSPSPVRVGGGVMRLSTQMSGRLKTPLLGLLDLSSNSLGQAPGFLDARRLTALSLRDNSIGDGGLAPLLGSSLVALSFLDMSMNRLRKLPPGFLSRLGCSRSLETLLVAENEVERAEDIADGLEGCTPSLLHLDLRGNPGCCPAVSGGGGAAGPPPGPVLDLLPENCWEAFVTVEELEGANEEAGLNSLSEEEAEACLRYRLILLAAAPALCTLDALVISPAERAIAQEAPSSPSPVQASHPDLEEKIRGEAAKMASPRDAGASYHRGASDSRGSLRAGGKAEDPKEARGSAKNSLSGPGGGGGRGTGPGRCMAGAEGGSSTTCVPPAALLVSPPQSSPAPLFPCTHSPHADGLVREYHQSNGGEAQNGEPAAYYEDSAAAVLGAEGIPLNGVFEHSQQTFLEETHPASAAVTAPGVAPPPVCLSSEEHWGVAAMSGPSAEVLPDSSFHVYSASELYAGPVVRGNVVGGVQRHAVVEGPFSSWRQVEEEEKSQQMHAASGESLREGTQTQAGGPEPSVREGSKEGTRLVPLEQQPDRSLPLDRSASLVASEVQRPGPLIGMETQGEGIVNEMAAPSGTASLRTGPRSEGKGGGGIDVPTSSVCSMPNNSVSARPSVGTNSIPPAGSIRLPSGSAPAASRVFPGPSIQGPSLARIPEDQNEGEEVGGAVGGSVAAPYSRVSSRQPPSATSAFNPSRLNSQSQQSRDPIAVTAAGDPATVQAQEQGAQRLAAGFSGFPFLPSRLPSRTHSQPPATRGKGGTEGNHLGPPASAAAPSPHHSLLTAPAAFERPPASSRPLPPSAKGNADTEVPQRPPDASGGPVLLETVVGDASNGVGVHSGGTTGGVSMKPSPHALTCPPAFSLLRGDGAASAGASFAAGSPHAVARSAPVVPGESRERLPIFGRGSTASVCVPSPSHAVPSPKGDSASVSAGPGAETSHREGVEGARVETQGAGGGYDEPVSGEPGAGGPRPFFEGGVEELEGRRQSRESIEAFWKSVADGGGLLPWPLPSGPPSRQASTRINEGGGTQAGPGGPGASRGVVESPVVNLAREGGLEGQQGKAEDAFVNLAREGGLEGQQGKAEDAFGMGIFFAASDSRVGGGGNPGGWRDEVEKEAANDGWVGGGGNELGTVSLGKVGGVSGKSDQRGEGEEKENPLRNDSLRRARCADGTFNTAHAPAASKAFTAPLPSHPSGVSPPPPFRSLPLAARGAAMASRLGASSGVFNPPSRGTPAERSNPMSTQMKEAEAAAARCMGVRGEVPTLDPAGADAFRLGLGGGGGNFQQEVSAGAVGSAQQGQQMTAHVHSQSLHQGRGGDDASRSLLRQREVDLHAAAMRRLSEAPTFRPAPVSGGGECTASPPLSPAEMPDASAPQNSFGGGGGVGSHLLPPRIRMHENSQSSDAVLMQTGENSVFSTSRAPPSACRSAPPALQGPKPMGPLQEMQSRLLNVSRGDTPAASLCLTAPPAVGHVGEDAGGARTDANGVSSSTRAAVPGAAHSAGPSASGRPSQGPPYESAGPGSVRNGVGQWQASRSDWSRVLPVSPETAKNETISLPGRNGAPASPHITPGVTSAVPPDSVSRCAGTSRDMQPLQLSLREESDGAQGRELAIVEGSGSRLLKGREVDAGGDPAAVGGDAMWVRTVAPGIPSVPGDGGLRITVRALPSEAAGPQLRRLGQNSRLVSSPPRRVLSPRRRHTEGADGPVGTCPFATTLGPGLTVEDRVPLSRSNEETGETLFVTVGGDGVVPRVTTSSSQMRTSKTPLPLANPLPGSVGVPEGMNPDPAVLPLCTCGHASPPKHNAGEGGRPPSGTTADWAVVESAFGSSPMGPPLAVSDRRPEPWRLGGQATSRAEVLYSARVASRCAQLNQLSSWQSGGVDGQGAEGTGRNGSPTVSACPRCSVGISVLPPSPQCQPHNLALALTAAPAASPSTPTPPECSLLLHAGPGPHSHRRTASLPRPLDVSRLPISQKGIVLAALHQRESGAASSLWPAVALFEHQRRERLSAAGGQDSQAAAAGGVLSLSPAARAAREAKAIAESLRGGRDAQGVPVPRQPWEEPCAELEGVPCLAEPGIALGAGAGGREDGGSVGRGRKGKKAPPPGTKIYSDLGGQGGLGLSRDESAGRLGSNHEGGGRHGSRDGQSLERSRSNLGAWGAAESLREGSGRGNGGSLTESPTRNLLFPSSPADAEAAAGETMEKEELSDLPNASSPFFPQREPPKRSASASARLGGGLQPPTLSSSSGLLSPGRPKRSTTVGGVPRSPNADFSPLPPGGIGRVKAAAADRVEGRLSREGGSLLPLRRASSGGGSGSGANRQMRSGRWSERERMRESDQQDRQPGSSRGPRTPPRSRASGFPGNGGAGSFSPSPLASPKQQAMSFLSRVAHGLGLDAREGGEEMLEGGEGFVEQSSHHQQSQSHSRLRPNAGGGSSKGARSIAAPPLAYQDSVPRSPSRSVSRKSRRPDEDPTAGPLSEGGGTEIFVGEGEGEQEFGGGGGQFEALGGESDGLAEPQSFRAASERPATSASRGREGSRRKSVGRSGGPPPPVGNAQGGMPGSVRSSTGRRVPSHSPSRPSQSEGHLLNLTARSGPAEPRRDDFDEGEFHGDEEGEEGYSEEQEEGNDREMFASRKDELSRSQSPAASGRLHRSPRERRGQSGRLEVPASPDSKRVSRSASRNANSSAAFSGPPQTQTGGGGGGTSPSPRSDRSPRVGGGIREEGVASVRRVSGSGSGREGSTRRALESVLSRAPAGSAVESQLATLRSVEDQIRELEEKRMQRKKSKSKLRGGKGTGGSRRREVLPDGDETVRSRPAAPRDPLAASFQFTQRSADVTPASASHSVSERASQRSHRGSGGDYAFSPLEEDEHAVGGIVDLVEEGLRHKPPQTPPGHPTRAKTFHSRGRKSDRPTGAGAGRGGLHSTWGGRRGGNEGAMVGEDYVHEGDDDLGFEPPIHVTDVYGKSTEVAASSRTATARSQGQGGTTRSKGSARVVRDRSGRLEGGLGGGAPSGGLRSGSSDGVQSLSVRGGGGVSGGQSCRDTAGSLHGNGGGKRRMDSDSETEGGCVVLQGTFRSAVPASSSVRVGGNETEVRAGPGRSFEYSTKGRLLRDKKPHSKVEGQNLSRSRTSRSSQVAQAPAAQPQQTPPPQEEVWSPPSFQPSEQEETPDGVFAFAEGTNAQSPAAASRGRGGGLHRSGEGVAAENTDRQRKDGVSESMSTRGRNDVGGGFEEGSDGYEGRLSEKSSGRQVTGQFSDHAQASSLLSQPRRSKKKKSLKRGQSHHSHSSLQRDSPSDAFSPSQSRLPAQAVSKSRGVGGMLIVGEAGGRVVEMEGEYEEEEEEIGYEKEGKKNHSSPPRSPSRVGSSTQQFSSRAPVSRSVSRSPQKQPTKDFETLEEPQGDDSQRPDRTPPFPFREDVTSRSQARTPVSGRRRRRRSRESPFESLQLTLSDKRGGQVEGLRRSGRSRSRRTGGQRERDAKVGGGSAGAGREGCQWTGDGGREVEWTEEREDRGEEGVEELGDTGGTPSSSASSLRAAPFPFPFPNFTPSASASAAPEAQYENESDAMWRKEKTSATKYLPPPIFLHEEEEDDDGVREGPAGLYDSETASRRRGGGRDGDNENEKDAFSSTHFPFPFAPPADTGAPPPFSESAQEKKIISRNESRKGETERVLSRGSPRENFKKRGEGDRHEERKRSAGSLIESYWAQQTQSRADGPRDMSDHELSKVKKSGRGRERERVGKDGQLRTVNSKNGRGGSPESLARLTASLISSPAASLPGVIVVAPVHRHTGGRRGDVSDRSFPNSYRRPLTASSSQGATSRTLRQTAEEGYKKNSRKRQAAEGGGAEGGSVRGRPREERSALHTGSGKVGEVGEAFGEDEHAEGWEEGGWGDGDEDEGERQRQAFRTPAFGADSRSLDEFGEEGDGGGGEFVLDSTGDRGRGDVQSTQKRRERPASSVGRSRSAWVRSAAASAGGVAASTTRSPSRGGGGANERGQGREPVESFEEEEAEEEESEVEFFGDQVEEEEEDEDEEDEEDEEELERLYRLRDEAVRGILQNLHNGEGEEKGVQEEEGDFSESEESEEDEKDQSPTQGRSRLDHSASVPPSRTIRSYPKIRPSSSPSPSASAAHTSPRRLASSSSPGSQKNLSSRRPQTQRHLSRSDDHSRSLRERGAPTPPPFSPAAASSQRRLSETRSRRNQSGRLTYASASPHQGPRGRSFRRASEDSEMMGEEMERETESDGCPRVALPLSPSGHKRPHQISAQSGRQASSSSCKGRGGKSKWIPAGRGEEAPYGPSLPAASLSSPNVPNQWPPPSPSLGGSPPPDTMPSPSKRHASGDPFLPPSRSPNQPGVSPHLPPDSVSVSVLCSRTLPARPQVSPHVPASFPAPHTVPVSLSPSAPRRSSPLFPSSQAHAQALSSSRLPDSHPTQTVLLPSVTFPVPPPPPPLVEPSSSIQKIGQSEARADLTTVRGRQETGSGPRTPAHSPHPTRLPLETRLASAASICFAPAPAHEAPRSEGIPVVRASEEGGTAATAVQQAGRLDFRRREAPTAAGGRREQSSEGALPNTETVGVPAADLGAWASRSRLPAGSLEKRLLHEQPPSASMGGGLETAVRAEAEAAVSGRERERGRSDHFSVSREGSAVVVAGAPLLPTPPTPPHFIPPSGASNENERIPRTTLLPSERGGVRKNPPLATLLDVSDDPDRRDRGPFPFSFQVERSRSRETCRERERKRERERQRVGTPTALEGNLGLRSSTIRGRCFSPPPPPSPSPGRPAEGPSPVGPPESDSSVVPPKGGIASTNTGGGNALQSPWKSRERSKSPLRTIQTERESQRASASLGTLLREARREIFREDPRPSSATLGASCDVQGVPFRPSARHGLLGFGGGSASFSCSSRLTQQPPVTLGDPNLTSLFSVHPAVRASAFESVESECSLTGEREKRVGAALSSRQPWGYTGDRGREGSAGPANEWIAADRGRAWAWEEAGRLISRRMREKAQENRARRMECLKGEVAARRRARRGGEGGVASPDMGCMVGGVEEEEGDRELRRRRVQEGEEDEWEMGDGTRSRALSPSALFESPLLDARRAKTTAPLPTSRNATGRAHSQTRGRGTVGERQRVPLREQQKQRVVEALPRQSFESSRVWAGGRRQRGRGLSRCAGPAVGRNIRVSLDRFLQGSESSDDGGRAASRAAFALASRSESRVDDRLPPPDSTAACVEIPVSPCLSMDSSGPVPGPLAAGTGPRLPFRHLLNQSRRREEEGHGGTGSAGRGKQVLVGGVKEMKNSNEGRQNRKTKVDGQAHSSRLLSLYEALSSSSAPPPLRGPSAPSMRPPRHTVSTE